MLKGIAAAASAMLPRMRAQEVIANNLANASTAGFKRDRVFDQSLSAAQASLMKDAPDWQMGHTAGIAIDHTPGTLERTDNPLHVAIDGDGFFAVSTPSGERYTRNGVFQVSSDGVLTTSEGNPVLGRGGEIQVGAGMLDIGQDGSVKVDGLDVGQLRIVRFRDPDTLIRTSASLFGTGDAIVLPMDDTESLLRQGFIEGSNVTTIEELVDMIATMRIYESGQKTIQIQDDSLGRAINDMGRVR